MSRRVFFIAAAAAGCLAPPASADGLVDIMCMERGALVARLTGTNGEERVGLGLNAPDALIEVWANPETGDWTMVRGYADGRHCIVALGRAWDVPQSADPS